MTSSLTFGQDLKRRRLLRNLTQAQLGKRVDLDGSYIARLEMDDRHPSRKVVLDLGKALKILPEDIDRWLTQTNHLPQGDWEKLLEATNIPWNHPVIQVVVNALQDKDLSPKAREGLEEEIVSYVRFRLAEIKKQDKVTVSMQ